MMNGTQSRTLTRRRGLLVMQRLAPLSTRPVFFGVGTWYAMSGGRSSEVMWVTVHVNIHTCKWSLNRPHTGMRPMMCTMLSLTLAGVERGACNWVCHVSRFRSFGCRSIMVVGNGGHPLREKSEPGEQLGALLHTCVAGKWYKPNTSTSVLSGVWFNGSNMSSSVHALFWGGCSGGRAGGTATATGRSWPKAATHVCL